VPTSSFLSSSSARAAHSSSSTETTTESFILPAPSASRSAVSQSVGRSSNRPQQGAQERHRSEDDRGSGSGRDASKRPRAGPEKQAAALTSHASGSLTRSVLCCLGQCLARRRRLGLYTLPPVPSWRPPIGEGASCWRPLIGPGHQAGCCRFEAASSATNVTATPSGHTHWLVVALNNHQ
jgi:hypothetical protein